MPRASRFVQPVPCNCSSTTHAAQPDASRLQLVPEDAVLLDEVLDDLLLVAVDPSSDDHEQQPHGLKIGCHTPILPTTCTRHGSAQYSDTTVWVVDSMGEPNVRKSSGIISVALP